MSDMTHSEAEQALASGDEEDVAEALEAEREEDEAAPRGGCDEQRVHRGAD